MKIGFHIKFSGNLKRLTNEVSKTRGNVFQFFSRSIRGGRTPIVTEKQLQNYYNYLFEKKISTIIMLAPYGFKVAGKDISSNLAVDNEIAVKEILKDLEFAKLIHAKYYVVNAGYRKEQSAETSLSHLKRQLKEIISSTTWNGNILIRNMAGGGTEIGCDLKQLADIVGNEPRIQVAMDFGRAFSYGYSFLKPEDGERLIQEIADKIGWDKIPLIYINDTNRFCGSRREDVAPLGDGVIGFYGYQHLLQSRGLLSKIWMVENQPDVTYYDRTINYLVNFHRNKNNEKEA